MGGCQPSREIIERLKTRQRNEQYFTYDYVPIDPPPQNNSKEHLPKPAPGLQ